MKTASFTASELLQPGYWFLYRKQLYEICAWDSNRPLQVAARADGTDEQQLFTLTELFAADLPARFATTAAELMAPEKTTEATEIPLLDTARGHANLGSCWRSRTLIRPR